MQAISKDLTNVFKRPISFLLVFVLAFSLTALLGGCHKQQNNDEEVIAIVTPSPSPTPEPVETTVSPVIEEPVKEEKFIKETDQTVVLGEEFPSQYVLLLNAETGEVLAEKNAFTPMNPASMIKVLTLLVAVENIPETDGTFTMTREISEYCFVNECSVVGYIVGETVPIEELFYGCILCSGADACLALAELAAGSHEAFVDLMNQKLVELNLDETAHVTNCVGLYDENHNCTMADMAMIMKAALENEKCRKIICTKVLNSVPTEEHPEGQVLSNWFVRSLEDKNSGVVHVLGGKRGYVPQSGNCAVSYGETDDGQAYICVTGRSYSQKQAIYDHAALYEEYCN